MQCSFGKLCAKARDDAGFTQESAEPLLLVSVRSISDYERGVTPVPEDVVLRMMDAYHARWLGYAYLQQTNRVGQAILPAITVDRHFAQSILNLRVEMKHVGAVQDEIDEIGMDGHVDHHEHPRWLMCAKELHELAGTLFAVLLSPLHKEKDRSRAA
ncbi:helix-turn-helix domain-containing protein [Anaeroselena agilis]|uniref:Helix-turn-helix transcriptional regulator n=1 Tax=Anaeroselena agilis TaxID=3063788 RepID=A0ABU3NWE3_9FIRM|nr:helix-turn-helix transcriptional regulator [Selenomonadales bacterium 4137-cl]